MCLDIFLKTNRKTCDFNSILRKKNHPKLIFLLNFSQVSFSVHYIRLYTANKSLGFRFDD